VGRAELRTIITVRAPIERVFEHLTDHEAMGRWPGVGGCRVVREGKPRNGRGAIREVKARGLTLLEEVVVFDPPHRFDYQIVKGLPVAHRGTVHLVPSADGVVVTWDITMASRWPLIAEIACAQLRTGLPKALAFFKRETESAPR
jgi:uncharacterized protein YndB with AHSA1/START domain